VHDQAKSCIVFTRASENLLPAPDSQWKDIANPGRITLLSTGLILVWRCGALSGVGDECLK
jgi:hypothetical protein